MSNFDLVILYSGGADSRLMLHWALEFGRKPYCILIDYEQKHVRELDYAIQQLSELNVSYQVVKLHGLRLNSGLTGDFKVGRWEDVNPVNVPGRNSMFISVAYSIAENIDVSEIWMGADYSDRENLFPDCYQEYIIKMNEMLKVASVKPIKLVAPLLGWTKEMVLTYLQKIAEVEMKTIHSGYEEPKNDYDQSCRKFCEEVI